MWKIEIYENHVWKQYGQPSADFHRLWTICERFAANGQKARVVRA